MPTTDESSALQRKKTKRCNLRLACGPGRWREASAYPAGIGALRDLPAVREPSRAMSDLLLSDHGSTKNATARSACSRLVNASSPEAIAAGRASPAPVGENSFPARMAASSLSCSSCSCLSYINRSSVCHFTARCMRVTAAVIITPAYVRVACSRPEPPTPRWNGPNNNVGSPAPIKRTMSAATASLLPSRFIV
jgi:hypothetical protein